MPPRLRQPGRLGSCSSPTSYSSLADGAHKFEVRAIDQAGNADQSADSFEWSIDTIAPDTQITLKPAALTNSASASFSFSGTDAGSGVASFQCRRDSAEPADWASCSSPTSYSSLADGAHSFEVRAVDQAGNADQSADSFEWTVDTTAPQTTIDSHPAPVAASSAASFAFSGTDGVSGIASFECRRDSEEWAPCTSPRSYTALAEGAHSFEVRAIDKVGNTDPSPATFNWSIDTIAPNTTIDSKPAVLTNSANATSASRALTGGSGVASFQCRRDSSNPADWAACTSPQSYSSLADGAHNFEVRAIDQAGNADQSADSFEWSIDTTAPDTQITLKPAALTNSASASFSFSGSDTGGSGVASFQCRRDWRRRSPPAPRRRATARSPTAPTASKCGRSTTPATPTRAPIASNGRSTRRRRWWRSTPSPNRC